MTKNPFMETILFLEKKKKVNVRQFTKDRD